MDFEDQKDRLTKHLTSQANYFSQSKQDSSYILRFTKVQLVYGCCGTDLPGMIPS